MKFLQFNFIIDEYVVEFLFQTSDYIFYGIQVIDFLDGNFSIQRLFFFFNSRKITLFLSKIRIRGLQTSFFIPYRQNTYPCPHLSHILETSKNWQNQ